MLLRNLLPTREELELLINCILCIDQGTTNSKAVLADHRGTIIAQGSAELAIHHPQPGWVEQSANDIWSSVLAAIKQCLASAPEVTIQAIGISNQRESIVQWDAVSGESIGPAITWQCRRTTKETQRLKAEGIEPQILEKTGLPLDPLFPASKMRWLLDLPGSANRCIGTVDSWLIWNLTAGKQYATDCSNASRTQLLNVQTGQWDEELCSIFGIDSEILPTVTDSGFLFGKTSDVPGLSDGIPVASAMGDSHAALFGHAAFQPGEAKATFGTGSSVMMVAPGFTTPKNGMTTTIAWSMQGSITYALEGNILVSASLFPWVATLLGLDGDVDQLMALAESVDHSNGVALVPALVGLGAPHWRPEARGELSGLSFSSGPAHIAHAAALSLPLQAVDVFKAMYQQSSVNRGKIYVDGGPSKNTFLMSQLANLLSQPIVVSADPEISALGAGMLAGLTTGFWSDQSEIASLSRERVTIEPSMSDDERARILKIWSHAVNKCCQSSS